MKFIQKKGKDTNMTRKRPVQWTKLDNAAKIFPPNTNEKDTKVFRFICELNEEVDKDVLEEALNKTMTLFPIYHSVLRKGVFWYYLESSDIKPEVREEYKPPCSTLYVPNKKNLLFEVTYYKKRINLEVYHVIADGTGALAFFKTLLHYYITIKHSEDFKDVMPTLEYDASFSQKMDDSFLKHYTGEKVLRMVKVPKAYRITGRRSIDNRLKIIEGIMSVKEVITLAHNHNTTLTVYLTALFIRAIYDEMAERSKKHPVVLTIPVNLRSFFPSVTARNFFGTITISYDFSKNGDDLQTIIKEVKEAFARELTQEKLRTHMNRLSALEHNVFMRVVPLFIKDWVLRIANNINDKGITATLSNVGKITVAKELEPYINLFNCFNSARRPQIAMCSFGDKLIVSFASPFDGTDIQKNFYRMLTAEGAKVVITSSVT